MPLRDLGVPVQWIGHGTRAEILAEIGLTTGAVTDRVHGWIEALSAPARTELSSVSHG